MNKRAPSLHRTPPGLLPGRTEAQAGPSWGPPRPSPGLEPLPVPPPAKQGGLPEGSALPASVSAAAQTPRWQTEASKDRGLRD